MPRFFIQVTNGEFHSRDDGSEYTGAGDALALGVRSAVDIAADEIARGERSAAVVISIEQGDGSQVLRSVVVVSVSPLKIATREELSTS